MNFKVARYQLLNSLQKVARAVSAKTPLPALTGIRFEIKNDKLYLLGSDADITIETIIENNENENILTVYEEGSVVITAKYILEIVRKIDSDYIEFELLDGALTRISGNSSEFKINGIKINEYPNIDLSKPEKYFSIDASLLKNVISQTIFATSDKETRPVLTGVNFKCSGGLVECVATDSYRLAKKSFNIDHELNFNITVPAKSLNEVSKIIDKDSNIDIYVSGKKIQFIFENTIIQTRLIDGLFPDTSKLIPTIFNTTLKVDTREILNSIDRASLMTTEVNHIIKLNMYPNAVELSSRSQEVGSVKEKLMETELNGNNLEISFSGKYVSEALRAINSTEVIISFSGEMKPFIIKNTKDDSVVQLVLPVRTF